jgi:class 3 adenylate cyclase
MATHPVDPTKQQVHYPVDPPEEQVHFSCVFSACHKALDYLRQCLAKDQQEVQSMSVLLVPKLDAANPTQECRFFPLTVLGVPVPLPRYAPVSPSRWPGSLSQWACEVSSPVLYGDLWCKGVQGKVPWAFPEEFKDFLGHWADLVGNSAKDKPGSLVVIPLLPADGQKPPWGVITVFLRRPYAYLPLKTAELLLAANAHPADPKLMFKENWETLKRWKAGHPDTPEIPHNSFAPLPQGDNTQRDLGSAFEKFDARAQELSEYLRWATHRETVTEDDADGECVARWNRLPLKSYGILRKRTGGLKRHVLSEGHMLKTIAVLFADIRGFTEASARLRNEFAHLPAVLQGYFDTMWTIIVKHGGEVDKFEGDGIMALFGTADREGCTEVALAMQAAETAAEMCRAFTGTKGTKEKIVELLKGYLKQEHVDAARSELDLGIGIMVGSAYIDFFGADWQKTFTALGPTVNYAKKLETKAAKPANSGGRFQNILLAFGLGILNPQEAELKLKEKLRDHGKLKLVADGKTLGQVFPNGDLDDALKEFALFQMCPRDQAGAAGPAVAAANG